MLAMVLAHYLTKRIIEPIEKMAEDLDNIENYVPYPELAPFAHAVQTAQEQKKANEEQRREFTANVSHELKTPLTSIMGYSEMIETGLVKEEDVKIFAAKIHTEAERQLHLIGDIIQLSELDVEQSKENFVSVDLYTLAESVIEYLSFAAQKYQVSLSADGEHLQVLGNKNLLEELVYNLCDNAIRYNKPGGWVKISIYKHGERTALAVSDDGIGISPQDQARIFERFYRVDKSRSRDTGGTGLGLAIVKHIALQHEAQIFVKSLPDMGRRLRLFLKLRKRKMKNKKSARKSRFFIRRNRPYFLCAGEREAPLRQYSLKCNARSPRNHLRYLMRAGFLCPREIQIPPWHGESSSCRLLKSARQALDCPSPSCRRRDKYGIDYRLKRSKTTGAP